MTDVTTRCTDSDVEERIGHLRSLTDCLDDVESDARVFSAPANETRYEPLRMLYITETDLYTSGNSYVAESNNQSYLTADNHTMSGL